MPRKRLGTPPTPGSVESLLVRKAALFAALAVLFAELLV
jgi:hypothetical protein